MMTNIVIPLSIDEREAVTKLSQIEMRGAKQQIRKIVCDELVRRGLLSQKNNTGVCEFADPHASVMSATN